MLCGMIFWTRPRFEWRVRTQVAAAGRPHANYGDREPFSRTAGATVCGTLGGVGESGRGGGGGCGGRGRGHCGPGARDGEAGPTPPDSSEEEQDRLLPVLEGLRHARPSTVVSVGVHYAETARAAARRARRFSATFSGLRVGRRDCRSGGADRVRAGAAMHTRGRSREWLAQGPMSNDELVPAIFTGLCERLMLAEEAGIDVDQIVADPGTGSCQRGAEEIALLAGLGRLQQIDRPLLLGMQLCAPAERACGRALANKRFRGRRAAEDRNCCRECGGDSCRGAFAAGT